MRYLAILKDSLLETIDAKVLWIMGGVFAILVLLASCIAFRPMTMEEKLQQGMNQINFLLRIQAQGQRGQQGQQGQDKGQEGPQAIQFELADFKQTNDAAEAWNGDFRFQVLMKYPASKDAAQQRMMMRMLRGMARMSGTPSDPIRPFLQGQAPWLIISDVKEENSTDPATEIYRVTTKGTKITERSQWPHEPSLFFGALPLGWLGFDPSLGQGLFFIENFIVNGVGAWVVMIIGIIITGFFVPNMLRKGTVDLLLSKPINRGGLLLVKYLGGLLFVFLCLSGVVLGIWAMLGLRTGIWSTAFLLAIPVLTFYFAVLYSLSVLCAVLTRSPIVCILASLGLWLLLCGVGTANSTVEGLQRTEARLTKAIAEAEKEGEQPPEVPFRLSVPKWVASALSAVEFALPRFRDLDQLTRRTLSEQLLSSDERRAENAEEAEDGEPARKNVNWWESLGISTAFIVVLLGLACWRFNAIDY